MPDTFALMDESVRMTLRDGVCFCDAEDERFDGRELRVAGRDLVNFSSCSYLGLELDPRVMRGAIDAIERFGTCVSSSRVFLSAPPYAELEELLGALFGASVLVTPTTTLGHLTALPVLIGPEDAVLLDRQVHASVQTAAAPLRLYGTHVETVPHSDLDRIAERVEALGREREHVWYLADGLYSMYADFAPVDKMIELQCRYERLHVYYDDAHSMSWTGAQGRGHVLGSRPLPERTIVAVSLAKGFGSGGGGALIAPDPETAHLLRRRGAPMYFSGPVPPAVLGAAVASARIHLSPEIDTLQAELASRIELCNRLLAQHGVPVASTTQTPIRFVPFGPPEVTCAVAKRLQEEGLFTSPGIYPAVARNKTGIRFTLTRHHTTADIERMVARLADCLKELGPGAENAAESESAA